MNKVEAAKRTEKILEAMWNRIRWGYVRGDKATDREILTEAVAAAKDIRAQAGIAEGEMATTSEHASGTQLGDLLAVYDGYHADCSRSRILFRAAVVGATSIDVALAQAAKDGVAGILGDDGELPEEVS